MQHLRTGRVITAPSVAAFARKARLGIYGQYHFDNVLKGHRLHHSGWGLKQTLERRLDVRDVWGNRWKGTLRDLRQHLSSTAVRRLAKGECIGPVCPASKPADDASKHRPIRYTGYAVRRDGRLYKGSTLKEVAAKVGVSYVTIWALVHGQRHSTRCGLKLHRVYTTRRAALPMR